MSTYAFEFSCTSYTPVTYGSGSPVASRQITFHAMRVVHVRPSIVVCNFTHVSTYRRAIAKVAQSHAPANNRDKKTKILWASLSYYSSLAPNVFKVCI